MKTYVITLSKRFPTGHNRAGEPTHFWEKFIKGRDNYSCIYRDFWETTIPKIHTIRANYPLWKKRIAEVERGEACLSIRQWTGKPYRSKQVEIARLTKEDGVGIQRLGICERQTRAASYRNCVSAKKRNCSERRFIVRGLGELVQKLRPRTAYGNHPLHQIPLLI